MNRVCDAAIVAMGVSDTVPYGADRIGYRRKQVLDVSLKALMPEVSTVFVVIGVQYLTIKEKGYSKNNMQLCLFADLSFSMYLDVQVVQIKMHSARKLSTSSRKKAHRRAA